MRPVPAEVPPATGVPAMSNASIHTHDPSVPGPRSCVTSIENVCSPGARPLAWNSTRWYCEIELYVLITCIVPSRYTVARPAYASATPIHTMPVPLNVIEARAPFVFVKTAWPPVFAAESFVYQLPL